MEGFRVNIITNFKTISVIANNIREEGVIANEVGKKKGHIFKKEQFYVFI